MPVAIRPRSPARLSPERVVLCLASCTLLISALIPVALSATPPTASAAAAQSSGTWSHSQPIASDIYRLNSVSCATAKFCVAVGQANDGEGLAFVYNGATWSASKLAGSYSLSSVSCPSANFCAAVGEKQEGSDGNAFTFDGTAWSASTLSDPSTLDSVSCVLKAFCVAVDASGDAVKYDGTAWSTPELVDPDGIIAGQGRPLSSVSCATTSFCAAVDEGGGALTYNRGAWSRPKFIMPSGTGVTAVSCPSVGYCVAVSAGPFAITLNGTSWSAPRVVNAANSEYLTSVSCVATRTCTAVGQTVGGSGGPAFELNGTSWSAPVPIDHDDDLISVSCPSASFCVAIGTSGDAFTYNGGPPTVTRTTTTTVKATTSSREALGLAALWNKRCQDCHYFPPTLTGAKVLAEYQALLRKTQDELVPSPAEAAVFFQHLSADGLATFVLVSGSMGPDVLTSLTRLPARILDGMQVLGVAIASERLSARQATAYAMAFVRPTIRGGFASGTTGYPGLAALTIVYDWLHGYLLAPVAAMDSTERTLLGLAISTKQGWGFTVAGAATYAARTTSALGHPPLVDNFAPWDHQVFADTIDPIFTLLKANVITSLRQGEESSNIWATGITAFIAAGIAIPVLGAPVAVLGALVGLTMGLLGATGTSGVAQDFTSATGLDDEELATTAMYCIDALLSKGDVHLAGSTGALADTPVNIQKVWVAYVDVEDPAQRSAYSVTSIDNGQNTPSQNLLATLVGPPNFVTSTS
jgi:hypothetical protein